MFGRLWGFVRLGVWRIFVLSKKELASYFNSAVAYIVIIFFLGFTAMWLFFIQQFQVRNIADLRPYFALIPSLFIVIIPALTMRSWAEERKLGTEELLITLPYRDGDLVLGKFFCLLDLLLIMLILSLPVPLLVSPLGDFEFGQIAGQYLGVFLVGCASISIGMFISALSSNQITAFIFSVIILLVLSLINQVNVLLDPPRPIAAVLEYLSLPRHFRSFELGLIDTRDVVFYLSTIWFFLYMNIKVLDWRKR